MRPVLNPALRLLWRSATTLQLGVDPRHRVVLDGLTPSGETVLGLLDGTRDLAGVVAAADALGVARTDAEGLLDLLLSHGAIEDAAVAPSLPARDRDRLVGELAELSLVSPPGSAASALDRRQSARVLVVGCGRLGAAVGALLAASGVGHLTLRDERHSTLSDVAPGAPVEGAVGVPRVVAAGRLATAAGCVDVDAAVARPGAEDFAAADVAVVTGSLHAAAPAWLVAELAAAGLPWLLAGVRETVGVVGPAVHPGRTACPRCFDLTRADRDPTWPTVAAQLAGEPGPEGGSAAMVAIVAALAVAELLALLGGPTAPRCVDATVEVTAADWSVRRRAWAPHERCACVSPGVARAS